MFLFPALAGRVTYNLTDFVVKSNDKIRDNILNVISRSTHPLVRNLFPAPAAPSSPVKRSSITAIANSLGAQFQRQLRELLSLKIEPNEPHFIRCINPTNADLKAQGIYFDNDIVREQLRYSGIVSVCVVRKEGYPYRCLHSDFVQRFQVCFPSSADVESMVTSFAEEYSFPSTMIVKGRTMVLIKTEPHELLARLYEVTNFMKSLSEATERRDIALLSSEIERSAQVLAANSTKISKGRKEQYEKVITRAKQILCVVQMETKLEATISERQIAELQAVLKEAAAIVIPVGEEINLRSLIEEAKTLLCLLRRQEELKTKLKSALLAEGNYEGLEVLLKSCEKEELDFPEMEHARSAITLLHAVSGGDPALIGFELSKCSSYYELPMTFKSTVNARLKKLNDARSALEDALKSSEISDIRSALDSAKDVGLDASVDFMRQANVRIHQFERQEEIRAYVIKAVDEGDRNQLEHFLGTCHEEKLDFSELKFASALLELLIALEKGDLNSLDAMESECANLGNVSPHIRDKVRARRSRMEEALDALVLATNNRDLEALKASLRRVEELGLSETLEVIVKAREAVALLDRKECVRSGLVSAMSFGDKMKLEEWVGVNEEEKWGLPESKPAKAVLELLEAMRLGNLAALDLYYKDCEGYLSKDFREEVKARRARIEEEEQEKRALDALVLAANSGDLEVLKASLQRAKELGLSESLEVIGKAREAVALLERKECVRSGLVSAMSFGDKMKLEEWVGVNEEEKWGLPESKPAKAVLELLEAMRLGNLAALDLYYKDCEGYLSKDFREEVKARRARIEEEEQEKRALDALVLATNNRDLNELEASLRRVKKLGLSETLEAIANATALCSSMKFVRSDLLSAISSSDKEKLEKLIRINEKERLGLPEAEHAKAVVALLVAMSTEDLKAINENYDQCERWGVLTPEIKTSADNIRKNLSEKAEVIRLLVESVDSGTLDFLKVAIGKAEEIGLDRAVPEFAAALLAYDSLDILTALSSLINNISLAQLNHAVDRAMRHGFTKESCLPLQQVLEQRSVLLAREKALEALQAAESSTDFSQVQGALSQGDNAGLKSESVYYRVWQRLDVMELVRSTLTSVSEETVDRAVLFAEAQSLSTWSLTMKLKERSEKLTRESALLKELNFLLEHATVSDIYRLSSMLSVFNSDNFLKKEECAYDVRRAEECLLSLLKKSEEERAQWLRQKDMEMEKAEENRARRLRLANDEVEKAAQERKRRLRKTEIEIEIGKAEKERTRRLGQTEIEIDISSPLSVHELQSLVSELKDLDTEKYLEASANLQMDQRLHHNLLNNLESEHRVENWLAMLRMARDLMVSGGYYLTKEYVEALKRATELIEKEEKIREVHDLLREKTFSTLSRGLEMARSYNLDSEEIRQAEVDDSRLDDIRGLCILLKREVDRLVAREKEISIRKATSNSASEAPATTANRWDVLDILLIEAEEKV